MNLFKEKEITGSQTLGDKLRLAREEEGLTLAVVEKATKIRKEYLDYLENSLYEKLPGEVYLRNFIITYATFLKLSPKKAIALFEKENKIYQKITPVEKHPQNGKNVVATHPFFNPQFLRHSLVVLIIFAVLFYLGLEINKIIAPPYLVVETPSEENLITSEHSLNISGETEKESKIMINGQEILADQNGHFQTTVDLKEGINVLKISAVKKLSKETVVYKRIRVEEKST